VEDPRNPHGYPRQATPAEGQEREELVTWFLQVRSGKVGGMSPVLSALAFLKEAFGPAEAGGVLNAAKKYIVRKGNAVGAGYAGAPGGVNGLKYMSGVLADHGADVGKARAHLTSNHQSSPLAPWVKNKVIFSPERGDAASKFRSITKGHNDEVSVALRHHTSKMSPTERRTLDGVIKGHELDEVQVPSRMAFQPIGHNSPDVMLREHNRVTTLPADHANVKGMMQTLRGPGGEEGSVLKEYGVNYGDSPRLSRHARKRITGLMERDMLAANKEDFMAQAATLR
jgi:hypothetical protein